MRYGPLLGWGIVVYSLMFLLWTGFLTYGFVGSYLPRIAGLVALVGLGIIAGRSLRVHSWLDVLPYSLAWGVMMGLLDIIFTVPLTGWQVFADWNVWLGYSIVVIAPLCAPYLRFEQFVRSGTPV